MLPNKKTLNPKNNSPWLLCPSKSFPGKFYYFNGSTGEAAWGLSENDKAIKKDAIRKVTDGTHSYPEPFGPPLEESPNTTNSFSSLRNIGSTATQTEFGNYVAKEINHSLPAPVFGQAVFPKYIPAEVYTPKVVWTLTPMYVQNQPTQPQRDTMDQICQTYEIDQPMYVQTSSMPLNNRFQTIKRTVNFAPEPNQYQFSYNCSTPYKYFKEKPAFDPAPKNPFKLSKETQTFGEQLPMKDEACQTFVPIKAKRVRIRSESESTPKSVLKPSRSVDNLSSILSMDIETSTKSPLHKVDNAKANKLKELEDNDLRFLLIAKKRKVAPDVTSKPEGQSKSETLKFLTPKKRVTFDLQDSGDTSSEDSPEIEPSPNSSDIQELNQPVNSGPLWYVVADTSILLSDLQDIEEFVKSDPRCRLLIPYGVYTQVGVLSRGDRGMLAARKLLRRLAGPTEHIVVESKPEYELESTENSILQCCWNVMQESCHVILLTNNENLINNAKSIDLECCNLEEMMKLKDDTQPTPERPSEIRKMKIVVPNDKNKSENLFMKDISEVNSFSFTKINGFPVHESRTNLYNETKVDNVFGKKDTNSDKLINLTKTKNNLNAMFNYETTNAKDKIVTLNAENIAAQNRTRQILRNVFSNRHDEIEQNMKNSDIGVNKHCNQNINEKNKFDALNQNPRNVPNDLEIIDELDRNIRELNFAENPVIVKDTIKVSGITKLNCQFNLDEELERFYVKNAIMENRIKSRLDEWVCRLNQIMEGVLTDILIKENAKVKRMMPPWNLFEAIQVTKETFKNQNSIKTIVDKFSMKHFSCASNNGKLAKNMKPNDLMKLIGFSAILIQHLIEIVNHTELHEADNMIGDLIKNIEDPNTDIDLSLEKINTPVFSRSEMSSSKPPVPFKKSRTEVLDYLKEHFEAWKTNETETPKGTNINNETMNNTEPNIVRTFGKNLNMLKINNTKTITVDTDKIHNEPKVIRNLKIIDTFENRLTEREELDLNKLDYDESVNTKTISSDGKRDDIEVITLDESDEKQNSSDNVGVFSDSVISDSNECIYASRLVKLFLLKLKKTFIQIYEFINECMQQYQKGMAVEKKRDIQLKTEMAYQYVLKFAERLKRIIERESGNTTTLKDLLIKAGDYVEDDEIMTNYKEIVTKYLEHAQKLEEALKIMLSLSNADPKDREGTYCGLKTSSPALPRLRSDQMVQLTTESFEL